MALHQIGLAREVLYDAIVGVLGDGRVSAYPRRQDVGTSIWLDEHRGGINSRTIEADFTVHVSADGSDKAQVAAIDDAVSRIWDECERASLLQPVRWDPATPITVGNQARRHYTITVRRQIGGRTLCLPDAPGVSPIPPELTQE